MEIARMLKHLVTMLLFSIAMFDAHAANVAPTVSVAATRINGQQAFVASASIVLSANAQDSDGTIASVSFYNGSTLLGTVTNGPTIFTWTNVPIGIYTVTAVATDNEGASTTSAPLPVNVAANVAPTISITSPVSNVPVIVTGNAGNVVLKANTNDEVGYVSNVRYYKNGVALFSPLIQLDWPTWQWTWKNAPVGTYTITAEAIDDSGVSTMSAPVTLIITNNVAPTVTMTATLTGTTAPGTITLSANASDSDGSISKVEFFNGAALLATVTQAPFAYTWSNVAAGSYSLTARATDNLGSATTTQPSVVTVGAGGPQLYYVYADQVNTAREITNAAGVLVWRADATEPFGANMPNDNPSSLGTFTYNPRFPGQYFDIETGLHYNYLRDYDPQTGRYVQSDPIGIYGGINTYAYVDNQPTMQTDPLGLMGSRGKAPPPLPYDPNFGSQNCGHYAPGTALRNLCEGFGNTPNANCARKCLKDKLPKDSDGNTCPVNDAKEPPSKWYYEDHPACWIECRWPTS
jgi:RHS repeat-associated protein